LFLPPNNDDIPHQDDASTPLGSTTDESYNGAISPFNAQKSKPMQDEDKSNLSTPRTDIFSSDEDFIFDQTLPTLTKPPLPAPKNAVSPATSLPLSLETVKSDRQKESINTPVLTSRRPSDVTQTAFQHQRASDLSRTNHLLSVHEDDNNPTSQSSANSQTTVSSNSDSLPKFSLSNNIKVEKSPIKDAKPVAAPITSKSSIINNNNTALVKMLKSINILA